MVRLVGGFPLITQRSSVQIRPPQPKKNKGLAGAISLAPSSFSVFFPVGRLAQRSTTCSPDGVLAKDSQVIDLAGLIQRKFRLDGHPPAPPASTASPPLRRSPPCRPGERGLAPPARRLQEDGVPAEGVQDLSSGSCCRGCGPAGGRLSSSCHPTPSCGGSGAASASTGPRSPPATSLGVLGLWTDWQISVLLSESDEVLARDSRARGLSLRDDGGRRNRPHPRRLHARLGPPGARPAEARLRSTPARRASDTGSGRWPTIFGQGPTPSSTESMPGCPGFNAGSLRTFLRSRHLLRRSETLPTEFPPVFQAEAERGTVRTVGASPRPDKTSRDGRYLHPARGASGPLRGTSVQAKEAGCVRYSTRRASRRWSVRSRRARPMP